MAEWSSTRAPQPVRNGWQRQSTRRPPEVRIQILSPRQRHSPESKPAEALLRIDPMPTEVFRNRQSESSEKGPMRQTVLCCSEDAQLDAIANESDTAEFSSALPAPGFRQTESARQPRPPAQTQPAYA